MRTVAAAIALLVTALLGIAGYVVQNKAAIAANATQHELVQEAAERQRHEDNAAKRLERVRDQQAYFINPISQYLVGQALPESMGGRPT